MIYQPRNVQPSNNSIDGTKTNYFSMEVSTNSMINGYALKIWDFNNNITYNGSKVDLDEPLYNGDTLSIEVDNTIGLVNGTDYKWSARLYQATFDMKITHGLLQDTGNTTTLYVQRNINIKPDMQIQVDGDNQTRTITNYVDNGVNGVITITPAFSTVPTIGTQYAIISNFIETTPEYIVRARADAVVTISNLPTILDRKYYEFIGSYTQSDNVPMVYYTWNLYLLGAQNDRRLIYTNGKTYSANINMYYDGFKTGQTYQIELIIETEFGVIATSGIRSFSIEYQTLEYLEQPFAQQVFNRNAIKIDWVTPTSFAPRSRNTNTFTGLVKDGNNTQIQVWLDNNLTISPGDTIVINNFLQDTILSYDAYTGLARLTFPLQIVPIEGDTYTVGSSYNDGLGGIVIHNNMPYRQVNSAELKNYSLSYTNPEAGNPIGIMPDDYNITMQFMPDTEFFYGSSGVYDDKANIVRIATDDVDGHGWITIFAHKYDIVAVTPSTSASTGYIALDYIASTSTAEEAYLTNGIEDFDRQKYITFVSYEYTEKVVAYDSTTKKVTFEKPLPFIPQVNDIVYMNDTFSTTFYNNINNVFALQVNAIKNIANDYVWLDSSTWNDDYFWVEGGTEIERIANNWWKLQLTDTELIVRQGGV